jgi:hypothetical protein
MKRKMSQSCPEKMTNVREKKLGLHIRHEKMTNVHEMSLGQFLLFYKKRCRNDVIRCRNDGKNDDN